MKFKTNIGRVINRDGNSYTSNNGIIDIPEILGKMYKLKSLEKTVTPKIKKKK